MIVLGGPKGIFYIMVMQILHGKILHGEDLIKTLVVISPGAR